jgi:hypothetical protein
VDNPALLYQFAQTLARRYAEMFSAARGFVLQLKEYKVGKTLRGWEILILHGSFSGARILMSPRALTPQLIAIKVSKNSRLQQALTRGARILALVITAPVCLAAVIQMRRVILALFLCIPIVLVLRVVLLSIVSLICLLFRPLDNYFDERVLTRILAVATEVPLPAAIDRSVFPTPPPPMPSAQPIPAYPTRRGPFGIRM